MFMKRFATLLFILLSAAWLGAQGTFQPKQLDEEEPKGLVFNRELAFDIMAHTNGFNVGVQWGKIKTYYKTRFFYAQLGEIKHPRENRANLDRSNASGQISRSFIYGKQNNLYTLRGGIGQKRYFTEKARKKGVAVGLSYKIGPTIGLLKPYYLELFTADNTPSPFANTRSVKYSDEVHDAFLNPWNIFGSASWVKGMDEIRPVPGLHTQVAVHIDWGAFDEYVKAAEAGIMIDVFPRTMPIMVDVPNVENKPVFINLFLNLQLGKRS